MKKKCVVCGRGFEASWRGLRRLTCSKKCRSDRKVEMNRLRRGAPSWKRCLVCESKFSPKGNSKTCSPKCSGELKRRHDSDNKKVANLSPEALAAKRAISRASYHRNIEASRARGRAKYWANPEVERAKRREQKRRFRERFPELAAATERAYRENNRDVIRARQQKYRDVRTAALRLIRELETKGIRALL